MAIVAHKGFKIVGKYQDIEHPMVRETIDFLASMDFCQSCVDQKNGYKLKIGDFEYNITFTDRTIRVS